MRTASTNQSGAAHKNGDVEQALRLRGSRNFVDRAAYARWLHELTRQRNATRH